MNNLAGSQARAQEQSSEKRVTVGHTIYAFNNGGMERGLLNVVNYGDREKFHHVILCLTEAGDFANLLAAPNCEVLELHKKEGNDWRLPWRIAAAARRRRIDVFHARGWPTLVETALGARLARVPGTLYVFEGKTFQDLQGIGFKRRWVQKAMIRSYQRVITLNRRMRADLAAECSLPEERIDIVANGVDVNIFRPREGRGQLRASLGLPAERLILGSVARLDPVKNHEVILRALVRAANDGSRPFFLLVGEGAHRAVLEREIQRLGLASDVRLFGYSDRIADLLNCMDLYIQSSFYEGFSHTLLEAMACGLPVVATDVGGTGDVLNEGREGFFFKPDDDETLASIIMRLRLDHQQRHLLGERARRRVSDHFPIQSMVRSYENLYLQLAQQNNRWKSSD
jgi:sugar transferase (PEP-CTERM/EpsH1 system associated)